MIAAEVDQLRRDAMVLEMARAVAPGAVCVQGLMTPLAAVALAVARAWHEDVELLLTDGCVLVDRAPVVSAFGGSLAPGGVRRRFTFTELICELVPSWQPFELMRPAQLDRLGRSNNVVIRQASGDFALPGPGGIPEATAVNGNLHYYLPRHDPRTLVGDVDFVSGACRTVDGRSLPVAVFTELCTFGPGDGGLELVALLPGVTVEDVRARTGFEVVAPQPPRMVPEPTDAEVELLATIDPARVRDLEFLGGARRADALRSLCGALDNGRR